MREYRSIIGLLVLIFILLGSSNIYFSFNFSNEVTRRIKDSEVEFVKVPLSAYLSKITLESINKVLEINFSLDSVRQAAVPDFRFDDNKLLSELVAKYKLNIDEEAYLRLIN